MGRIVKFSVVDANGACMSGQTVIAGDTSLTTGNGGLVQALLDEGTTTVTINGVKVYDGPVDALKPLEVFTATGKRVG